MKLSLSWQRTVFRPEKKNDYNKTLEYYNEFVEKYPNSEYMSEVTDWYNKSVKELKELNKTQ